MNHNRLERANRIARELFRNYHGKYPEHLSEKEKLHFSFEIQPFYGCGSYRKTKVFCSCPDCCGNPRRRKGGEERLPISERRWKDIS